MTNCVTQKSLNKQVGKLILDGKDVWIREKIESNLDTSNAKEHSYTDKVEIFIPYDAINTSKNGVLGRTKILKQELDKKYNAKVFGSIIFIDNKPKDGVIIRIEANTSLVDALNEKYNLQKQGIVETNKKRDNDTGEQLTLFSRFNDLEGIIATEKTIRDLSARLSDRIGIPVKFESDRSKNYKGKLENGTAYINLAYATLDTPIHEILGHPIIRAIKNQTISEYKVGHYEGGESLATFKTRSEAASFIDNHPNGDMLGISVPTTKQTDLYQNLLKELETGKGKEVLDRIKRDYVYKEKPFNPEWYKKYKSSRSSSNGYKVDYNETTGELEYYFKNQPITAEEYIENTRERYSLEEQQEEAIVELLGLMTAEKLDNVKDGKLISLLKRLLKEIKAFMKQLLNQKEVEIDKLPDNMTINDLADLLAYSNSKLILPGYEVEYTTPDNMKFKTYQEASNYIGQLTKSAEDVDLSNVKLNTSMPDTFEVEVPMGEDEPSNILKFTKENGQWYISDNWTGKNKIEEVDVIKYYQDPMGNYFGAKQNNISNFIENNKEYEQSKEIIEEWKKVNNIQYNPEEIYSRGQEFSSVVGAYSDFDVNLMMQNLLQHIEDNEKAGGKFAISAYTKPIDRQIGHLEGGGGKIKFKIYPQSNDILWASNIDVYSGSVWDASEKVNKDKKSELLGVSYSKYPALHNVNTVQPNLANIVDNLAHHHNELGIALTGNNFRLEYDEDIPYQTKKIIDGINKILDQKYGKLVKPEISKTNSNANKLAELQNRLKDLEEQEQDLFITSDYESIDNNYAEKLRNQIADVNEQIQNLKNTKSIGIQPTQTEDTLKESIESVHSKVYKTNRIIERKISNILDVPNIFKSTDKSGKDVIIEKQEDGKWIGGILGENKYYFSNDLVLDAYNKSLGNIKEKEYTEQALINTKIAKLKEVAKKYPRSLIRSEVVRTRELWKGEFSGFAEDELPFQKVTSTTVKPGVEEIFNENNELANIGTKEQYSQYLDTIFPDSQVKDIVYHGVVTGRKAYNNILEKGFDPYYKKNWDNYGENRIRNSGIFFSDIDTGYMYGGNVGTRVNNKGEYENFDDSTVIAAILNIEYLDSSQETSSGTAEKFYITNKDKSNIGMFGLEGGSEGVHDNYVVFEPEQIHILGSKQDIEGFKEFVNLPSDKSNILYSRFNAVEDFESNRTPIADTAIGDNYIALVNEKQNRLQDTEAKISVVNNKINNLKNISVNKERATEIKQLEEKLKTLRSNVNKLKDQIMYLSNNEVEFMFHAVTQDVQDIREELENSQIDTIANVKEKILFLEKFLAGVLEYSRSSEYKQEYDELVTDIQELLKTYDKKRKEKNLKFLEEDSNVKQALETLNSTEGEKELFGKTRDENTGELADFTLQDLLKADSDINILEAGVYGQNTNATPNTIIPAFLLDLYSRVEYQKTQKVNILKDRLQAFNTRTGMSDREFLFSRDSKGRKNGYIVDLYSEKWFRERNRIGKLISDFYKSPRTEKLDNYNKITTWLSNNAEVIDFTKIKSIRDTFEPVYGKYFTHSDSEMEQYEKRLKKQLGPLYENHIQEIERKLSEYEHLKNETISKGGSQRRLAQENIWEFNRNWSEGNSRAISYKYDINGVEYTSDVLFSNFKALTTIPLQETYDVATGELTDSGFYDKAFDEIKKDSNKRELWSIYREMSSYIESRYSSIPYTGRMSYPKFENELIEQIKENWDGVKKLNKKSFKKGGKLIHSLAHSWKAMFYEQGRFKSTDSNVNPNYVDTSKKNIADKMEAYVLQGYTKEEAKSMATGEVLENYSSDLDILFETLLSEAAIHDARIEVEPIAKSLFEEFVQIKDVRDKDRGNAISKLHSWIEANIYNQNSENSGRDSGTLLDSVDFQDSSVGQKITKVLDTVKWVQEYTSGKIGRPHKKFMTAYQKTKLYTDTEKELLDAFESLKGKPFDLENYQVKSGGFNLQVVTNEVLDENGNLVNFTMYKVNDIVVDKANFEIEFNKYLDYKIDSLGLDTTVAGAIDGIAKIIIMKSLGFGIVSGVFNRTEGMMTNMINDDGTYFTMGNTQVAKEILAFANMDKYFKDFIGGKHPYSKQLDTAATTGLLLQRLNVIQDRKNELQKSKENKFKLGGVLFRWSVDDPEFKNQATIVLSVLMDSMVTDDNGNQVPFLDKNTKQYNVFEIGKDGQLKLKKGFENFDLASEEMSRIVVKIQNVISKVQGNYNERDKIAVKRHVIGRAGFLMKSWLPEHYRQRWNPVNRKTSKGLNIDLIATQKKQSGGRYSEILNSQAPEIFAVKALATAGLGYFGFGAAGMLGMSMFTIMGAREVYRRIISKQPIERDVSGAVETAKFLQYTILETLNFPGKILSSFGGKYITLDNYVNRDNSDNIFLNPFKDHKHTEAQIRAIKSTARELALQVLFISMKLSAMALLYSPDDDEDSDERKFYNFIQNNLTRFYKTLDSWANPYTLVSDNGFISMWGYLELFKDFTIQLEDGEYAKASKKAMDIVGIPSVGSKYATKGDTFYQDSYSADRPFGAGAKEPLQWFYTWTKDYYKDEEALAKDDYADIRKEYREDIEKRVLEITSNKDVKKVLVDAIMEEKYGKKTGKISYIDALEKVEKDEPVAKPKTSTQRRKGIKDKLKELELKSSEISEILNKYEEIERD